MQKNNESQGALEAAIRHIEKQFGKGSIMSFQDHQDAEIEAVSTGSLSLDLALGIGGYPVGRIVEIYGPESSGKTTLSLHAIAEAQKEGGICAFVDTEHAFDPVYAQSVGVKLDKDKFIMSQPNNGEEALKITEHLVSSHAVKLLVVDSVAALVPKAEIEGDIGDSHMGLQARLMSQALRMLTPIISQSGCVVIFINQIRQKIGVIFGNPETTTGGNALKFYSSIRLDIRSGTRLKKNDEAYGSVTKVKVVKNKVAPPFKSVEFHILYGKGICRMSELITLGTQLNILEKSGSWYSYNGEKIGQGQEAVQLYLKNNSQKASEIERKIREHKNEVGLGPLSSLEESESKFNSSNE